MKKEFSVPLQGVTPQFITDSQGKNIGGFFSIQDYENLLEELEDFYLGALAIATRDETGARSLEEIKKELRTKPK